MIGDLERGFISPQVPGLRAAKMKTVKIDGEMLGS